jgi:NADPH:quinone reductase-like Zn-dependent oxidoreductase
MAGNSVLVIGGTGGVGKVTATGPPALGARVRTIQTPRGSG